MIVRARWLAILLVALLPAVAGRFVAAGCLGRDLAVLGDDGTVALFSEPGAAPRIHAFGEGVRALAVAPKAPVVAVLRRTDQVTALTLWNYADDTTIDAAPELIADALAVAFASGGHALFVLDGRGKVLVLGADDLTSRRELATAPLADDPLGLVLAASPRDWFVAAASRAGLQLGRTDGAGLEAVALEAARDAAPSLAFLPDSSAVVIGGDAGLWVVPTGDGPVRRLPVPGVAPSAAFDVGTDGQFVYLADGGKLHAVRLSTGLPHLTGVVRAGAARPRGAAVLAALGLVAVAYDDGTVCWYRPLARELAAQFPPLPESGLPPVGAPADATAALSALTEALTSVQLFASADPLVVAVLDEEFARLGDLEQLTRQHGWPALVLACAAARAGLTDAVPEPFRPVAPRLLLVDRIELASVTPIPELTPAGLERRLGPREATAIMRQLADQQSYPVFRFGPFGLPVAGETFPAGSSLTVTADYLRAFLRPPAEGR